MMSAVSTASSSGAVGFLRCVFGIGLTPGMPINGEEEAQGGRDRLETATGRCINRGDFQTRPGSWLQAHSNFFATSVISVTIVILPTGLAIRVRKRWRDETINEISRQVQESTRIANEAVEQLRKTNDSVSALSLAANRLGDVVDLINKIAGQTNLLALNATIEAARAGDAGLGSALVASK